MRCLTLAVELKQKYFEVSFISRNLPAYLRDMLKKMLHRLPLRGNYALNLQLTK